MIAQLWRDLAYLFILEGELTADDDEAARLGAIATELDARADAGEDSNPDWGMC